MHCPHVLLAQVFDFPSVAALTSYIGSKMPAGAPRTTSQAPAASAPAAPLKQLTSPALPKHAVSSIAVTGMSFRLPGATRSSHSLQAQDTITRIPHNRWDTVYASQQVGELQASFGSFVSGAAAFDAAAFGLPEAEALLMDPQQRLLMEASWESLGPAVSAASGAGACGAAAYRAACGVFVGVSSRDCFTLGKEYSQVQIKPDSAQASHFLEAVVWVMVDRAL